MLVHEKRWESKPVVLSSPNRLSIQIPSDMLHFRRFAQFG